MASVRPRKSSGEYRVKPLLELDDTLAGAAANIGHVAILRLASTIIQACPVAWIAPKMLTRI